MERSLEGKEIILGVTGSIAAYKAVEILRELTRRGAAVTVVMTESAQRFVAPLTFETLSRRPLLTDLFTLEYDKQIGHVASAGGADLLPVAPPTAHTIAKFAHGRAGPTSLPTPPGVTRTGFAAAEEMYPGVLDRLDDTTILIMAAAVADYRPSTPAAQKIKKREGKPGELGG